MQSILITGHLPSLGALASAMLGRGEVLYIAIEHGGLMQIFLEPGQDAGTLNWSLTPAQLGIIAGS